MSMRSTWPIKQIQAPIKNIQRQAGFKKRFKWFNTEYRFSEKIDKKFSFGYPVKIFLIMKSLYISILLKALKTKKRLALTVLNSRL